MFLPAEATSSRSPECQCMPVCAASGPACCHYSLMWNNYLCQPPHLTTSPYCWCGVVVVVWAAREVKAK
ncbi:hypothetical protein E2C01_030656 [Portunus trituberculatus]|uniref:Uncharacterized protein n=1 Tax=Portunus trituberculatus TaxID=210409 RepID=A0A5B7ESJ6_PORTR|nr:hypothetical protein [Portunus trituberculatus]